MAKDKRVNFIIGAKDHASAVFGKVKSGLSSLAGSVKGLVSPGGLIAGAATGFGLGALGSSFISTASSFEDLETSLTTTTGSLQKAREAMAFANREAAASPYTVMQYAEAIKTLTAYGIDYQKTMTTLGNTASAMGKPLQSAVEALADALQGEGERLKEFGIKQKVEGDKITYTWVDALGKVRETVAKNNPAIIQEVLTGIWNEKYAGGMERFANTWSGLTSTLKSLWGDFVNQTMQSGPFQTLKGFVKGLVDQINALKESGKLGEIAKSFGQNITAGILKVINFLPELARLIIKAVEYLLLALSGWKQMIAGGGALFTQVKIWSLEFINNLRLTFIRMLEGLNALPGVDTSASIRATYNDIGTTNESLDALERKLDEQLTALGKVQVEQDAMREKWNANAEAAKAMMEQVIAPAAEAAKAAASVGEAGAAGMAKANAAADTYLQKLDQIAKKQSMVSLGGGSTGGRTVFGDEQRLREMERTE